MVWSLYNDRPSIVTPHKTAPLAAPVLDAWRNGVWVNFARDMKLTAARALGNRYAVRGRSMRLIERRHNSPPNGGTGHATSIQLVDLSAF
jgi:hypothetical protein